MLYYIANIFFLRAFRYILLCSDHSVGHNGVFPTCLEKKYSKHVGSFRMFISVHFWDLVLPFSSVAKLILSPRKRGKPSIYTGRNTLPGPQIPKGQFTQPLWYCQYVYIEEGMNHLQRSLRNHWPKMVLKSMHKLKTNINFFDSSFTYFFEF